MKKKIILLITFLITIIGVLFFAITSSRSASTVVNGITWYYTVSNGEATYVYTSYNVSGDVVIPDMLGGYPVTSIGRSNGTSTNNSYNMFNKGYRTTSQVNTMDSLTIPSTVKTILPYAFKGVKVNNGIRIPKSVTNVGEYAFYNTYIPNVVFEQDDSENANSVTISNNAFYNARTTDVTLSDNVTTIGNYGFFNSYLTNITFGKGLVSINDSAFGSTRISSVELFEGLKSIGNNSFSGCQNLDYANIKLPNSLETVGNYAFELYDNSGECLEFGNKIQSIGEKVVYELKDIYVGVEKADLTYSRLAYTDNEPHMHFKGCKHIINFKPIDGVRFINDETNEELSGKTYVACRSEFKYRIEVSNSVNTNKYKLVKIKEGVYAGDEKIVEVEELNSQTITIDSINRDEDIYVQLLPEETDLSARMYINRINFETLGNSREPSLDVDDGEYIYLHNKKAVSVNKNDIIEYVVRIYNEGYVAGKANKVKVYVSDGLDFDETSLGNKNHGWEKDEDGNIVTEFTKGMNIKPTEGYLNVDYIDIPIVFKVNKDKTTKDQRMVAVAKIIEANQDDYDSSFGELNIANIDKYMEQEAENSDNSSYVSSSDDTTDFESVYLRGTDINNYGYSLKIYKIDDKTSHLLSGAKFKLTDEDGNEIATKVTSNQGDIIFDVNSLKEGKDIYYLEETDTPPGYSNTLNYKLRLEINKYKDNSGKINLTTYCDVEDIKLDASLIEKEKIETVDDLKNIESGKAYILENDLDLSQAEWTPLEDIENCLIDGNNHKITGLRIQKTTNDGKVYGLFKEFNGAIINLDLDVAIIQINESSNSVTEEEEKQRAVGALMGIANNVYIENCNVTGAISCSTSNIGGFIGQVKKDTLTVIRESKANFTIVQGKSNIGGFVGYSQGAVNIIDSNSNGQIRATYYNGSGFIGRADFTNYKWAKTFVNTENGIVNIVIGNEQVEVDSKYNLEISTVEADSLKLIPDAKYKIYNTDKEEIAEEKLKNVNGKIKIENIDITSIKSDAWYLEQIETKDGYKVATNDFIRVKVTKTWNSKNREFEVSVDGEIVPREDFETDKIDDGIEETDTNITFSTENSDNAIWLTGKIGIYDSKNNAKVDATYSNAGGMIARTDATILARNIENNGEINSVYNHAGGIIAESLDLNYRNNIKISNAVNNAVVTNQNSSRYYGCTVGGIIGTTNSITYIDKAKNKGAINGASVLAGGIVGNSATMYIEILNSENTAEITNNNGPIQGATGGILGRNAGTKNSSMNKNDIISGCTIKLENCKNTGNITSLAHAGGIVGFSASTNAVIYKCENNDNEITATGGDCGGIVGIMTASTLNVVNNTAENVVITESSPAVTKTGSIGGIVGTISEKLLFNQESFGNLQRAEINNNTVDNIEMTTTNPSGGVIGIIYESNGIYYLKNNDISKVSIKLVAKNQCPGMGGVYGAFYGNSSNNEKVNINKCNVTDFSVEGRVENSNFNIGGIAGSTMSTELEINDCKLDTINTISYYSSGTEVGGVIGFFDGAYNKIKDIKLKDIQVSNVKIEDFSLGSSHNIAGFIACSFYCNLYAKNCNLNDVDITANMGTGSFAGSMGTGAGFLGLQQDGKYEIEDCNIKNIKLYSNSLSLAGFIGSRPGLNYDAKNKVHNCSIDNMEVISEMPFTGTSLNDSTVSGFAGPIFGEFNVDGMKISNATIKGKTRYISGMFVYLNDNHQNLQNITIDNMKIIDEANADGSGNNTVGLQSSYQSRALFLNCTEGSSLNINNITVKNSRIQANALNAGVIDTATSNHKFNGINIYNVEIISKADAAYDASTSSTPAIGVFTRLESKSVKNIYINGLKLESNITHVGGLAGFGYTTTIENVKAKNIEIVHNDIGSSIVGYCNYYSIGALLGNTYSATLKNAEVTNSKITVKQGAIPTTYVGGIVGFGNSANIIDSTVKDVEISDKSSLGFVGGIIGLSGSNLSIENSNVQNTKIDNQCTINAGGRTGGAAGAITVSGAQKLKDIIVDNLEISDKADFAGGITGAIHNDLNNSGTNQIENLEVKNSKIAGATFVGGAVGFTRYDLESIKVTNTNVTSTTSMAGGIIGLTVGNIENVTVEDSNIKTNATETGYVGGIAGFTNRNIEKSEVKGCTIEATSDTAYGAGGIAGHTNNVDTDSTGKYLTHLKKCKVEDTTIKGKTGISELYGPKLELFEGSDEMPYVEECTVTNCTIDTGEI